ncbi:MULTISPECIES: hypothetical protein [Rhodomicrobium]|uniref:hypothetical protein n=1 Tax=Rhodomicrobium TaxID=1068 RepID=UPI000F742C98|nr:MULTISPECIES: hypothetical protein [Rhodomicrobium]
MATAPVTAADPGAERLAAVLGIDAGDVRLYLPLILPLGLELGGFIFLALGLAPRRREDAIATPAQDVATPDADAVAAPAPQAVAVAAKRGSAAYYLARLQADHPAIATRVVAGEISCYAGCIEAGLRKAPAKRRWDANEYAAATA